MLVAMEIPIVLEFSQGGDVMSQTQFETMRHMRSMNIIERIPFRIAVISEEMLFLPVLIQVQEHVNIRQLAQAHRF